MQSLNLLQFADTIVGIATPKGKGALGIIRLSGEESINLVQQIFSKSIAGALGGSFHYGNLRDNGEVLDDVIVSIFRAPHSYTGEDSVEISCHASPYILHRVVEILAALGARIAQKGEFTRRAFMHGKMDLLQAEAVADLINAENKTQLSMAKRQKDGELSRALALLEQQIIRIIALVESQLDFAEELDTGELPTSQIIRELHEIIHSINNLLLSFKHSQIFQDGVKIVIAGAPNAGKSTLLNSILGYDRAIVSNLAGTTRDSIEGRSYYHDLPLNWVDTAGLRRAQDEIEALGIERSYQQIQQADWVLLIFDINDFKLCELMEYEALLSQWERKFLLVANQIDRLKPQELAELKTACKPLANAPIFISAKDQNSVQSLLEQLYRHILPNWNTQGSPMLLKSWHVDLLEKIRHHLQATQADIERGIPYDLLDIHLKHALHYMRQLTGSKAEDAVLAYIFENFCIGK